MNIIDIWWPLKSQLVWSGIHGVVLNLIQILSLNEGANPWLNPEYVSNCNGIQMSMKFTRNTLYSIYSHTSNRGFYANFTLRSAYFLCSSLPCNLFFFPDAKLLPSIPVFGTQCTLYSQESHEEITQPNLAYILIVGTMYTTNLASYNDTIFHCIYCDPNTRQPIVAFHLTITITSVLHNFLLLLYNMTGTAI